MVVGGGGKERERKGEQRESGYVGDETRGKEEE